MPIPQHKYNNPRNTYRIVRSAPDDRDYDFGLIFKAIDPLPPYVNLTDKMPPVYDQQNCGSCTGNAIAAAFEYDLMKQKLPVFEPSRLFIYYNERLMEGDVGEDNGAQIRDGIKSIATYGVCPETLWPYDVTKFAVTPPTYAYHEALNYKALKYYTVGLNRPSIKQALAQGYPVVAGISVYESFESDAVAATGDVPMPAPGEQFLGGHCILIVGYSDKQQKLICRNSWGTDWGNAGYFSLPYEYCNPDLMMDLWCVVAVT